MALSWVKVTGRAGTEGRKVYVNSLYSDKDSPGTVSDTFEVEDGENTFETLDANRKPDNRVTIEVLPHPDEMDPQLVRLLPITGQKGPRMVKLQSPTRQKGRR